MNILLTLAVPLILAAVGICAVFGKADIFSALTRGAAEGLVTVKDMFPALVVLFPAVYMLRASGAIDALAAFLQPVLSLAGIPAKTVPLALLRPLSGGAATAAAAAVMMGSSETTFYVIAVYFGAAKIKKTRWAIPAALCADLAVFIASAIICRAMWG